MSYNTTVEITHDNLFAYITMLLFKFGNLRRRFIGLPLLSFLDKRLDVNAKKEYVNELCPPMFQDSLASRARIFKRMS